MYDVLQKRDTALEKYRAVIAENSNSPQADLARRYIKQAYKRSMIGGSAVAGLLGNFFLC